MDGMNTTTMRGAVACKRQKHVLDLQHQQSQQQQQQREDEDDSFSADGHAGNGRWKDGLFQCFRAGFFHPTLWNAWCCPQRIMVRIASRMKIDLFRPSRTQNDKKRLKPLRRLMPFLLFLLFFDLSLLECIFKECSLSDLAGIPADQQPQMRRQQYIRLGAEEHLIPADSLPRQDPTDSSTIITVTTGTIQQPAALSGAFAINDWFIWNEILDLILTIPLTIYLLLTMVRLRSAVRKAYGIQTGWMGSAEDCCLSFWCNCCAIVQMERQTLELNANDDMTIITETEECDNSTENAVVEAESTTTTNDFCRFWRKTYKAMFS